MAGSIGRLVGLLVGFGLVCSCSGSTTTTNDGNASVCNPGTRRCVGDTVRSCNALGTRETTVMTCVSGQCSAQGNDAFCNTGDSAGAAGSAGNPGSAGSPGSAGEPGSAGRPSTCAASEAVCNGRFATTCKSDGSGPQPGGMDCAASKQSCVSGECRDTECIGATKSCKDGKVYACAPDGSSLSLVKECAKNEVCDADSGYCLPRVCEPGKSTCDGTRIVTCNDLGTARLPASTDCAAQSKVCLAGSCANKVCVPSTTFCKGSDLYQCDPTGATSTLSRTCTAGAEHCEVTPAGLYAYCVSNACVAGQSVCSGDVIKLCNPDGSLPATGTACAKDEFCENATCKPRGCENVGSLLCKDKNVYSCGDHGPQLYYECEAGQVCQALLTSLEQASGGDSSDVVFCAPPVCPLNSTGCALDQLGPCAADGQSLSSVTSDCAASGKVCTTAGTCVASVTDTLGLNETAQVLSESIFMGNAIDVRSTRKLTELQMWIVSPSPRDLRWMVYEQVGNEFVLRAQKTTSESNSTGFVSSGAGSFSYQLVAGKRYALGVQISGESVGIYDTQPFGGKPSFGTLLGSVYSYSDFASNNATSFSVAGSFSSYGASYMKVTTEVP